MSTQRQNNKILIIGVLMLGAYFYTRPRYTQIQNTAGKAPALMPASVGAGVAQTAIGAFASFLTGLGQKSNDEVAVRYQKAISESPYLIADYLQPQTSINDIVSPDNWSDNINAFLA